jgi:hypothetical protein
VAPAACARYVGGGSGGGGGGGSGGRVVLACHGRRACAGAAWWGAAQAGRRAGAASECWLHLLLLVLLRVLLLLVLLLLRVGLLVLMLMLLVGLLGLLWGGRRGRWPLVYHALIIRLRTEAAQPIAAQLMPEVGRVIQQEAAQRLHGRRRRRRRRPLGWPSRGRRRVAAAAAARARVQAVRAHQAPHERTQQRDVRLQQAGLQLPLDPLLQVSIGDARPAGACGRQAGGGP